MDECKPLVVGFLRGQAAGDDVSEANITSSISQKDTSPGGRSQYASNWDTVERELKASEFAGMLNCSVDAPVTAETGCSLPTLMMPGVSLPDD